MLDELIRNDKAQFRRMEPLFKQVDVVAIADRREDRCIGAWAADPLLLQRLNYGRLGVAGRRFSKVLPGIELDQVQRLLHG